jgi:hypothetical protein
VLADDRDIYRSVLVLPGMILIRAGPAGPAIGSVLLSVATPCALAFAAARSRRLAMVLLGTGLVASCCLAGFTVLGMLM